MSVNTYGDIGDRTAGHAVRMMLKRGQPLMILERFGQKDPQPRNATLTRKYRRYESLPPATAPLAEGIPPEGSRLTSTIVTFVMEEYGDFVPLTNVLNDTHEDPVFKETMKLVGEQAAETIELVRFDFIKGGSNVYYANGVASRSLVNSPATRGDFRKVKRTFKRNRAKEITEIISATHKISTTPVEAAYVALGHTDLESDIRGITGFIPVSQYSDHTKKYPGELGSVESIRVVLSDLFKPWLAAGLAGTTYLSGGSAPASSLAADVYPIIVIAQDAYAIVPLQGKDAITPKVKNPGGTEIGDPLGQQGHVAWHTYQTGGILNQNWVARLEVAATANPS